LSSMDPEALAHELLAALSRGDTNITPPSARDASFDLAAAYATEEAAVRLRRAAGYVTAGRKVGYANKAVWRIFKLGTLVWAHMYNDTVRFADAAQTVALSVGHLSSPKIEPEIVFRLKEPLGPSGEIDAQRVLGSVEWLALGFEVIACPFPDWKFQPADFVAACGLHAALVVGAPLPIDTSKVGPLAEQLPSFKVKLLKNGQVGAEGSGKNSLRSPALCLGELAAAIAREPTAEPLAAGDLISSGTLTESLPMAPGETWEAVVEGIELPALTLRCEP